MRSACLIFFVTSVATAQNLPRWVVPNFTDLTIQTRSQRGLTTPQVETRYFKGARERVEHGPAQGRPGFLPFMVTIMECDERTFVHLRPRMKTYTAVVAHGPTERDPANRANDHEQGTLLRHVRTDDGHLVTITIDSVDTGERKQVAGYQATRLKTTVTIQPSKGANAKPGKVEADSWYLDIPGLNCHEDLRPVEWMRLYTPLLSHEYSEHPDHIDIKKSGVEPRGLVIEETVRDFSDGNRIINKVELMESSGEPLDPSLFEIPAGYTEGQPMSPIERINPEVNPK